MEPVTVTVLGPPPGIRHHQQRRAVTADPFNGPWMPRPTKQEWHTASDLADEEQRDKARAVLRHRKDAAMHENHRRALLGHLASLMWVRDVHWWQDRSGWQVAVFDGGGRPLAHLTPDPVDEATARRIVTRAVDWLAAPDHHLVSA
jgi:hypothetical protein